MPCALNLKQPLGGNEVKGRKYRGYALCALLCVSLCLTDTHYTCRLHSCCLFSSLGDTLMSICTSSDECFCVFMYCVDEIELCHNRPCFNTVCCVCIGCSLHVLVRCMGFICFEYNVRFPGILYRSIKHSIYLYTQQTF